MNRDQRVLFVKVKPTSVCVFGTGNRGNRGKDQNENSMANLKNVRYNGYMSPATKRKCASMLQAWIYTLGFSGSQSYMVQEKGRDHLTFVTLTLSADQVHSDQDIRRQMLTPFIQDLKREYGIEHYFWKAEKQANGRIHFHIILNQRIGHKQLRELWNKQQAKLGYIERYKAEREQWHRSGFRINRKALKYWPKESQLRAYHHGRSSNWQQPNSTDIHSLRNVNSAHSYIIKYCLKSTDQNKVSGRIWGSSDSLRLMTFTSNQISYFEQIDLHRLIANTGAQQINEDHFSITYNFTPHMLQHWAPSLFHRLIQDLIRFATILNGSYTPPLQTRAKAPPDRNRQTFISFPTHYGSAAA
jgi:hypothetical protein